MLRQGRSVDDCLALSTVPDGVSAAAVSAARGVPNKNLSGAQLIAVRTVSWRLGDPLSAAPNEIPDAHAFIVLDGTDAEKQIGLAGVLAPRGSLP
jgi:hypothetical protein